MLGQNRLREFLVLALFILSGMTSLVYQGVWIRVLSLGVGSTSTSISLVLSIFFGGLALGSYLSGKYADRIKNPLLAYGWIEGIIGIYAFGLMDLLLNFHNILSLFPLVGSFSWVGISLKFLLVAVFLFIPTTLMGATLPLLIRYFTTDKSDVGRSVSLLYGINTLGAVIGAFLVGFFFIPKFGVLFSNHINAIINIAILGMAYLLNRGDRQIFQSSEKTIATKSPIQLNLNHGLILAACFICGFSSIASEVVWSKYLGIFFGTNIFGLGLVLSLFLTGIALGSLLLSRIVNRVKNLNLLFIGLLMLSAMAILTSSLLFNIAPVIANVSTYYLGTSINLLTVKSIITGLILFVPTMAFGALFPLAIRLLTKEAKDAPRVVGSAYAINTVGSIAGSCLAGLVFIPLLGSAITLKIAVFALVILAAVFVAVKASNIRVLGFSATAMIMAMTITSEGINFKNIIKSAYFQSIDKDMSFSTVVQYFAHDFEDFLFIHEGKTAVISLSHDQQDGEDYKDYFRLKTNGLNESIYGKGAFHILPKYEALLGLLPYVFHENPQKSFVVGYGGGYTVDFFTSTEMEKVHVIELEEGILKAANVVYEGDNPITKRPNLDLKIEDARYVLANKLYAPYDIVVSQPSHSWLSGVANLFTQEFFQIVHKNLAHNGIFSQWLNLYNIDKKVLKSILKTFYTVFPHGAVFTDLEDDELIMIGSKTPLKINSETVAKLTGSTEWREKLQEVPMESVHDLLTNYSIAREQIIELTKDSPINTDINAFAEVNQSALFYTDYVHDLRPQDFLSENFSGDFENLLPQQKDNKEFLYNLLVSLQEQEKYDKTDILLRKYESMLGSKRSAQDSQRLGFLCFQSERYHCAHENMKAAFKAKKTEENLDWYLTTLTHLNRPHIVAKEYRANQKVGTGWSRCLYAEALLKTNQVQRLERIVSTIRKNPDSCGERLHRVLGMYYFAKQDYRLAIEHLDQFLENTTDVDVIEPYRLLSAAHLQLGQLSKAKDYTQTLHETVDSRKKHLRDMAEYYRSVNLTQDALMLDTRASMIQ